MSGSLRRIGLDQRDPSTNAAGTAEVPRRRVDSAVGGTKLQQGGFAYYGAVTSITTEDCLKNWGEDRSTLLDRYRFALEQALARANFLYCDEIVILQSFVIFLILLRRNDDARKIWTLTGLVVRIAQTLGIHRDGSHFGLSPFEVEMRRRLWWQICVLDARSSEDHGCDPTIVEAQFDAKMVRKARHTYMNVS